MKERGFTLIEMAVVLAIIAVLAAVLTPLVTGYLDQARVVRATADVKTIADAMRLHQRDTGRFPIYSSLSNAQTNSSYYNLLTGPGNPLVLTGTTFTGVSYTTTSSATIVGQLNNNVLGLSTASQVSNIGKVAYRGPYIGQIDADPWGNQYYVTATNLNPNSTSWAYVISAGPNGTWDTSPVQANTSTITVLGDDIVAVIK